MTIDVPNAFVQAEKPRAEDKDKAIMKITGRLVEILVNLHPDIHRTYVVEEKEKRVLNYMC